MDQSKIKEDIENILSQCRVDDFTSEIEWDKAVNMLLEYISKNYEAI